MKVMYSGLNIGPKVQSYVTDAKKVPNRYPVYFSQILSLFSFLFVLVWAHFAYASTITWDGGGSTNDWSECANWSGDTCPGSSDLATFDGTSSKDATIDASFAGTVGGISITAAYAGIITQARSLTINGQGYTQAGGTFTGATQDFQVNGSNWSLSGGTFTSTSGSLKLNRNFTITGGTFNHNSGTIALVATGLGNNDSNNVLSCNGATLNLVTISKANGWGNDVTFNSDCTIPLGTSPSNSMQGTLTNNGTITVTNNWTLSGGAYTQTAGATLTHSGSTLTVGGTLTLSGSSTFPAGITNINISCGSLSLPSGGTSPAGLTTLSVDRDIDNTGNLLPNGVAVTLTANCGGNGAANSTLTCGTAIFASVTISKANGWSNSVTVPSGCTAPIAGTNPTSSFGGASTFTNNGTTTVTGNWTLVQASFVQNSGATLIHTGTSVDIGGNITLNGSSTFPSGITQITTKNGGDLNLPATGTSPSGLTILNLDGDLNNTGNLLPNGVDLTLTANSSGNGASDATINCGNATFNSVTISKGNGWSNQITFPAGCTFPMAGNSPTSTMAGISTLTNNGTINVTGNWTISGGSYTQSSTSALTMTGSVLHANNITLSGGTFPSGVNTIIADGNFTLPASGTSPSGLRNLYALKDMNNTGNLMPDGVTVFLGYNNSSFQHTTDGTITCGNATYASITFDKPTGWASEMTLADNCNISGFLSRTVGGTVFNPGSSITWNVGGDYTINNSGFQFAGANLTVNLNGTSTQDITVAPTSAPGVIINKSSGIARLQSDLSTVSGAACTVQNGTYDLNGYNFTCGGAFTVQSSGTVQLKGSETTVTTPTLNSGSTVKYVGDGDSNADTFAIKDWSYKNLVIASTDSSDSFGPTDLLTNGLTTYWKFDETVASGSKTDTSGNSNSGTGQGTGGANNLPQPSTDLPTTSFTNVRSLDFDGTDDYVSSATQYSAPQVFSLSIWFKTSTASGHKLIGFEDNQTGQSTGSFDRSIYIGTDGKIYFEWYDGGVKSIVSGATLNDNSWHNVIATLNTSASPDAELWVDGVSQGTVSGGTAASYNGYWRVGSYKESGRTNASDGYYTGKVDDVRIFNRVLSSPEISAISSGSGSISNFTNLTVAGNLTISGGDFTAPTGTLTISGNFNHSGGTFTHNSGTVALNGSNQSITGSNTFNNFTKTATTTDTLTLGAGDTQTFVGTMTLQGASGNLLSLRSTSSPTQAKFDPQGTRTISYLDVKDNNNINATAINAVGTNSVNSGNNINWTFNQGPTVSGLGPSNLIDGSEITTSQPTFTISVDDPDAGDSVRFQIQIDDSGDFSSPVIDFTSALGASGGKSYTVGQAAGSGFYTHGAQGSFLSDSSYYWRVQGTDSLGATSTMVTANNGAKAFSVSTGSQGGGGGGSVQPGPSPSPSPPPGNFKITINSGDVSTKNPKVTIDLEADGGIDRVALSNRPDFAGFGIEPYFTPKPWNICWDNPALPEPIACPPGLYKVYAKFYTPDGQSSSPVDDEIILKPPTPEHVTTPTPAEPVRDAPITPPTGPSSTPPHFEVGGGSGNEVSSESPDSTSPGSETSSENASTTNTEAPGKPEVANNPPVAAESQVSSQVSSQSRSEPRTPIEKTFQIASEVTSAVSDIAIEAGHTVSLVAIKVVEEVPGGKVVVGTAAATGAAASLPSAMALRNYPLMGGVGGFGGGYLAWYDFVLLLRRWLYNLLSLLGFRKKRRYWGTVYDSKTKQPIDPAIVKLINIQNHKVIDTSITDLAGRYGFLVLPGKYYITVHKTHYAFPSNIAPDKQDLIYDNLYHGEVIEIVNESNVVTPNIPMDPIAFDWNQQAKKSFFRRMPYIELSYHIVLRVFYWVGFTAAFIMLFSNPNLFNTLVFGLYVIASLASWLSPKNPKWGRVTSKHYKVGGIYMELRPKETPMVILGKAITAPDGKFFLRAPREGSYHWIIKTGIDGQILRESDIHIGREGLVTKLVEI